MNKSCKSLNFSYALFFDKFLFIIIICYTEWEEILLFYI